VYILTNFGNTVLYTGVTSNLVKRVWEHKNKTIEGFTKKYNVTKLVFYETFDGIEQAIRREKYIKNLLREKKNKLVEEKNPGWKDLYQNIV